MSSLNLDITTFKASFKSEEACYNYLIASKWSQGYSCRKCGHHQYCKGKKWHHRRCNKCQYDESPTSNTLFHKLKFPINLAFRIAIQLCCEPEGKSSCQIAREHGICQSTAWFFKRKVQQAMTRSHTRAFYWKGDGVLKLRGKVNLREILLHETAFGLGVCLDVYDRVNPFTGEYFVETAHFQTFELKNHSKIKPNAKQISFHRRARGDAWTKGVLPFVDQRDESVQGFIRALLTWVKQTHIHVSRKHMFYYFCEFSYRYFKIQEHHKGFPLLIQIMIKHPWLAYKRFNET